MSFLSGGDSDKRGNYYENKFVVAKFAELLSGDVFSVQQESHIINEESGVDVIVVNNDKNKVFYQCKARNGVEDKWNISDLKPIIKKAFSQINSSHFILVSPLAQPTALIDFCNRSRSFNSLLDFETNAIDICGQEQKTAYKTIKSFFPNSATNEQVLAFFQKFRYEVFPDDEQFVKNILLTKSQVIDVNYVYDLLCGYVQTNNKLKISILALELRNYLQKNSISFFSIDKESEIIKISNIQNTFRESINRSRINGIDYERVETQLILDALDSSKFVVVSGDARSGKSAVIKQVCDKLSECNAVYLPINIAVDSLNGTLISYSQSFGLEHTFSRTLSNLAGDKKAFIILDQMDTIRWKSQNSKSRDLCHEIVKESMSYGNVSILFVVRKIDAVNVTNMISYENGAQNRNQHISEINVGNINNQLIQKIIPQYTTLSSGVKALFYTIGNIKLFLDIKSDTKNHITTTPELIKVFLDEKIYELNNNGFTEAQSLLEKIVGLMVKESVLSITQAQLSKFTSETIRAASGVGLIEISEKNCISFPHQTIFDYFIAHGLYDEYAKGINVDRIIIKYNDEPLEKFETIKQFFELLKRNHIDDFCNVLEKVLFNKSIRFVLKRLALDFFITLGAVSKGYIVLYNKLISAKEYGEKHYYELTAGKDYAIKEFISSGILDRLIDSKDLNKKDLALSILMSVQFSDITVERIKRMISQLKNEFNIENLLYRIEDDKSCDELFEVKLDLLKMDKSPNYYIQWDSLLKKNPDRAFRYLEVIFGGKKEYRCQFDTQSDEKREMLELLFQKYGKQINELTKNYMRNVENGNFKVKYFESGSLRRVDNTDRAISLFIMTLRFLDAKTVWEFFGDDLFRNVVIGGICDLDDDIGLYILKQIIETDFISKENFQYDLLMIFKIKKIIEKWWHSLCHSEFKKLVKQIIDYKNPNIIRFAKERFAQRKEGYWYSFYGEEQKVLLEAIPFNKLTLNSQEFLKHLKRKFERAEMFNPGYRSSWSYSVASGINRNKKEFSRKTWVKILTSQKAGRATRQARQSDLVNGVEYSTEQMFFNGMVEDAAYKNRALFVDILLKENELRDEFVRCILRGISSRYSNKVCEVECDISLILQAHKKHFDINDVGVIEALITFSQNYDCADEWLINKLLELTNLTNKSNSYTYSSKNDLDSYQHNWQYHFRNTPSGAVCSLAKQLWSHEREPEWFDSVFSVCLNSGDMQMGISGIELLYAFCRIDKDKCINLLFELLYKFPNLIESNEATRLIDYSITKNHKKYLTFFKAKKKEFSKAASEMIAVKQFAYYCLYNLYRKNLKCAISGCKKESGANFSSVSADIAEHNSCEKILKRTEYAIKMLARYAPEEAGQIFIFMDKNLKFYFERKLIPLLIKKTSSKYDRTTDIYSLNKTIKGLPSLIQYQDIIFSTASKYIRTATKASYNIKEVIQWLIDLYWEAGKKHKRLQKKCLGKIDMIYKTYCLSGTLIG